MEYEEHEKRAWSVDFSRTEPSMLISGSDDCKVFENADSLICPLKGQSYEILINTAMWNWGFLPMEHGQSWYFLFLFFLNRYMLSNFEWSTGQSMVYKTGGKCP